MSKIFDILDCDTLPVNSIQLALPQHPQTFPLIRKRYQQELKEGYRNTL